MKKIIKYGIILAISLFVLVFGLNSYVVLSTKGKIVDENYSFKDIDCILILGAGVWNEKPSPMLEERLDKGIELYKLGAAKKIIMSGDHGRDNYDEVNVMKDYAISKGVASEDIFMDHAGFSTYDSIYRLKHIFGVKKTIIVTQKYHLYRSIYIAKKLNLKVYGVNATKTRYSGATKREIREVLARDKDFFKCIVKPKSKYLGEEIYVNGDGNITNDKTTQKAGI